MELYLRRTPIPWETIHFATGLVLGSATLAGLLLAADKYLSRFRQHTIALPKVPKNIAKRFGDQWLRDGAAGSPLESPHERSLSADE